MERSLNNIKKTRLNCKEDIHNLNDDSFKTEEEDRLSTLPDFLLADILSLLPIHHAAATSVLSRRWRHFWTHLTCLHFDCLRFQSLNFSHLSTIVDHILQQLTSPKIRSFHLHYPCPENDHEIEKWYSYFASWIPNICTRNPENIKVILQSSFMTKVPLPIPVCVFESPFLMDLELTGDFNCELPDDVVLPCLKYLEFGSFNLAPHILSKFIKSCSLLESLSLKLEWEEDGVVMEISGQNLKSLAVHMEGRSQSNKISIDAPRLENVRLHGCFAFYSFVNKQGTLQGVDLGFNPDLFRNNDYLGHLPELLQGISTVRNLHLFNNLGVFNVFLNYKIGKVLRSFSNLTRLRLNFVSLDHANRDAPVPGFLFLKIKCIELDQLKGDENDLKLIKFLLKYGKVLEELYVRVLWFHVGTEDYHVWWELKFCKELFMLPKKSLTCKIKFSGNYIDTSNDDFHNGFMTCRIDWRNQLGRFGDVIKN